MDIEFKCYHCGQRLVVDAAGAGQSVNCPKCQAELVVPQAQPDSKKESFKPPFAGPSPTPQPGPIPTGPLPATSPPITHKSKRRIGKMLAIVGLLFAVLAIIFSKAHPKPADQLQKVIKRFTALSAASADADSFAFDVIPSPSGSLVTPYVGTVDYVVPLVVIVWNNIAEMKRVKCRVHVSTVFAYQDSVWVFKELEPDVDRAGAEYVPYNHQLFTVPLTFFLDAESKSIMEQHRKCWQTATGR